MVDPTKEELMSYAWHFASEFDKVLALFLADAPVAADDSPLFDEALLDNHPLCNARLHASEQNPSRLSVAFEALTPQQLQGLRRKGGHSRTIVFGGPRTKAGPEAQSVTDSSADIQQEDESRQ
mmetsp:Transcript_7128/g.14028  ORF Transcript_7128/g.14028 Transcript_7128/m.14028 type:complete len:123 (-) Transcript_7128:105-473(-)